MAEITKNDIFKSIVKLQRIGKRLPYMDRIRTAEDKDKSYDQLMDELVQTWWDLLAPKHIDVDRWNRAVDRACLINTPNAQIIQPAIVLDALKEIVREDLDVQRTAYKAAMSEDKGRYIPSDDLKAIMKWTRVTMVERKDLAQKHNIIMDFMRPITEVIARAKKELGLTEQEAREQLSLLRCWDNDLNFEQRTGRKARSMVVFDGQKMRLVLV